MKIPKRTEEAHKIARKEQAHKVARKIAEVMRKLQISGALTVFIHEDKSVSVGISGEITEKINKLFNKKQVSCKQN